MKKLFLDIETVPAGKEKHKLLKGIYDKRKADGKKMSGTVKEYIESTGFDGSFGRIICISYAINTGEPQSLSGDEKETLKKFWLIAKDVNLFVGHNIYDFDLRFIYQRSVIFGVRPTQDLPFARYRKSPIYDTMYEWNKWNFQSKISLDNLAKALGLETSKGGEIEGKNVAKAYGKGKIEEIIKYCEDDIRVTRNIYNKMTFADTGKDDISF